MKKNRYFTLLLVSVFSLSFIYGHQAPQPLALPTQEEMEQILAQLSEEDIKALEKIGEQIIEDAKKSGNPLFPPLPKNPDKEPIKKSDIDVTPQKTDTPKQKPMQTEKSSSNYAKEPSSQQKKHMMRILEMILDALASIRQKAESDEAMALIIAPINAQLSEFVHLITLVKQEKHIKYLFDEKSLSLRTRLEGLVKNLQSIDLSLSVPDIDDEVLNIKKLQMQLKHALSILRRFVDFFKEKIDLDNVLKEIKDLIKKYDPEALEIKKGKENQEKNATEQAKKSPITNYAMTCPSISSNRSFSQHYNTHPKNNRAQGSLTTTKPSRKKQTTKNSAYLSDHPDEKKKAGEKQTPEQSKENEKTKEGNDTQQKKAKEKTPEEISAEHYQLAKEAVDTLVHYADVHENAILAFLSYVDGPAGSHVQINPHGSNDFAALTRYARRAHKKVKEWDDKVDDLDPTIHDYKDIKNRFEDYFTRQGNSLIQIHRRAKNIDLSKPLSSPRKEKHENVLKKFTNRVNKMIEYIEKDWL